MRLHHQMFADAVLEHAELAEMVYLHAHKGHERMWDNGHGYEQIGHHVAFNLRSARPGSHAIQRLWMLDVTVTWLSDRERAWGLHILGMHHLANHASGRLWRVVGRHQMLSEYTRQLIAQAVKLRVQVKEGEVVADQPNYSTFRA